MLDRAQALGRERRWAEARALMEEARAAHPANGRVLDFHALACHALGDHAAARAGWEAAIAARGAAPHRLRRLAEACFNAGDWAAAASALAQLEAAAPLAGGDEALLLLCRLALGDPAARPRAAGFPAWPEAERDTAAKRLGLLARRMGEALPSLPFLDIATAWQAALSTRYPALLTASLEAARRLGLWEEALALLERLTALDATGTRWLRPRFDLLLRLGRPAEAKALIAAFRAAAPQEAEGEAAAALERLLRARGGWERALDAPLIGGGFAALALRAAALLTLLREAEALVALEQGMGRIGRHPWLLHLSALASARLGRDAEARAFAEEAAPAGTFFAIAHARLLQVQGRRQAAAAALRDMLPIHGRHHAIRDLAQRLEVLPPGWTPPPAPPVPSGGATWLHGGDLGDVAYALAAMQAGGGGTLLLTPVPDTREPMEERKRLFLAPLLDAQPYVTAVRPWAGEAVTHDFLAVRLGGMGGVDLISLHWRAVLPDVPVDLLSPWLRAPGAERHGRPVFARSARYRNRRWTALWAELKATSPEAIFVGTAEEHAEFAHGEHLLARDALELAQVIAGASVFVGNQSFPYALAEGLKVGRMLEVSEAHPNCSFPGALRLDLSAFARALG